MSKRSRHFVLASLLIMLALVASACGGSEEAAKKTEGEPKKEPYKIGAVLSLTGTYAGLGEPEKNVIEMEVERINEAGGVNGHDLVVLIEDDATDAQKAVAKTTKLIDQDEVMAIIGATGSGQTMAMRPEIDRAGIPQVSCAGATAITAQFDPLVFQTPWSNSIVVPYTLEYMKSKGIEKVALITDTGGFGKDGQAVVKSHVGAAGLELVADETFNPGDTDMSAQLTRVKSAGADAVLLVNAGKEASIVAKNMRSLGMEIPLVGTHGNARTEFISGAAEAAEGFVFPAGKILLPEENYPKDSDAYKVATEFVERYTERYGKAPDTFAGHAYDALYITVEAMKRLDEGFTSADLRDEIEKTDGWVGIGGTFTFSAEDHNGLKESDLVMYKVQGGKWVLEK